MTALDFYKNRLKDRGFSEKQIKDLTEHKDLPWLQFAEDYHAKQLILSGVSKSIAKQYAEFCVRCDREGLPLLELDDYIKQYCC